MRENLIFLYQNFLKEEKQKNEKDKNFGYGTLRSNGT